MTEEKKGFRLDWATLKLAVILFAFAAVVAILLGLVNKVTSERIAAFNAEKTAAAMRAVLPAESYTRVEDSAAYKIDLVRDIYTADDKGWVVMVVPTGFGGELEIAVGVDMAEEVTGVSIIRMSETSGLGANAKNTSFREQYIGRGGTLAVNKDGGEIQALTGATITSRAVTRGVNAALAAAAALDD